MDVTRRLPIRLRLTCVDRTHVWGFTLHEALVSLTIVGIISLGGMSIARLLQNNGMAADVNTLIADLSLARSESIKRVQPVTVCKSDTGADCNSAAQWHEGWIVFGDINEDGNLDDGEDVVRVSQKLKRGLNLNYTGFGPGSSNYVTYQPSGMTKSQNGTFRFCHSTIARTVILYWTGRVRTSTTEADGDPINCP